MTRKLPFNDKLLGFDGLPITIEGKEVSLREVCVSALLQIHPGEKPSSGHKYWRYELAKKLHLGADELDSFAVDELLKLIGNNYAVFIVGPAFDMLEGKTLPTGDAASANSATEAASSSEFQDADADSVPADPCPEIG